MAWVKTSRKHSAATAAIHSHRDDRPMTDPDEINPRKALELGMDRPISRRDFFDGVIAATGIAAACSLPGIGGRNTSPAKGAEDLELSPDTSYPPSLTG